MARPRTFDPDKVLNTARDIFWRKGYQGTSFDDITTETGLTKPSLYAAFGDKASLFLKILDRYHDFLLSLSAKALTTGPSARDSITSWLTGLLPYFSGSEASRGCLSVNTLTDSSLDNDALGKSVADFNSRLENLVLTRLESDRAQFSEEFDPAATARAIMAIYFGLLVMARQSPSPKKVKAVIGQISKLLA